MRAAAVAVVAILCAAAQFPFHHPSCDDAIEPLRLAASEGPRLLEPRISGGFAWAPFEAPKRGAQETADLHQLKLMGAAGEVLARRGSDPSPAGRHAAAAARLTSGHGQEALDILESLEDRELDAATWNDLAAAHYAVAAAGAPEHLESAIAAVDASLHLSGRSPEALFNRALILERIGVHAAAREAWRRYLEVDGSSAWSTEASHHLHTLSGTRKDFRRELELAYDRLAGGDRATADTLAAAFPQECRTWGEVEILGRWAEALTKADPQRAEHQLAVARALGEALQKRSGEELLARSVEAIDAADADARRAIAEAILIYRRGRIAYARQRHGEAEPLLRDGARRLGEVGSPLALLARYFLACSIFDQYRVDEARSILEAVASAVPPNAKALRALVAWEKGLCEISAGHWGRAGALHAQSAARFEELGETQDAAFQHGLISDVYERLGDFREAWRERLVAVGGLADGSDSSRAALSGMTRVAALQHNWRAAASLVAIELELSTPSSPDDLFVDALVRRALIAWHQNNLAAARASIAEATAALRGDFDPSVRERLQTDLSFAAAVVDSAAGSESIDRLTKAIAFHSQKGRRMFLPELLLVRSRAYRLSGDRAAGRADLLAGINELESQRKTIGEERSRTGFFDPARDLFTDLVTMSIDDGDDGSALFYADRFRGRLLADRLQPGDDRLDPASLPDGVAVVESLLLPDRLITFAIDRSGIRHVVSAVAERTFAHDVTRFSEAVRTGDEAIARSLGSELYVRLIDPVRSFITSSRTLILVPDPQLEQLPFAALRNAASGRYLIEEQTLAVSPAASLAMSWLRKPLVLPANPQVLVVANPHRDDLESLADAEREATAVAGAYRSPIVLRDRAATKSAFLQQLDRADVVHFAGHGVAPRGGPESALLLAEQRGDDGRLFAGEIAALQLHRPRLVVLAACSTAAGKGNGGEGAASVARAFLSAGVPSVVATLWPVDDAAAQPLFARIHENLNRRVDPAAALRLAQLESIARSAPIREWAAIRVLAGPSAGRKG